MNTHTQHNKQSLFGFPLDAVRVRAEFGIIKFSENPEDTARAAKLAKNWQANCLADLPGIAELKRVNEAACRAFQEQGKEAPALNPCSYVLWADDAAVKALNAFQAEVEESELSLRPLYYKIRTQGRHDLFDVELEQSEGQGRFVTRTSAEMLEAFGDHPDFAVPAQWLVLECDDLFWLTISRDMPNLFEREAAY